MVQNDSQLMIASSTNFAFVFSVSLVSMSGSKW